jgi:hypothetical protein
MPASDMLKNGTIWTETCAYMEELDLLSERVNEVVKMVDPVFYQSLLQLRDAVQENSSMKALNSIDQLLLEGRELLFNRKSGPHKDSQDPTGGYAGLYALGNFKGGNLRVNLLKGSIRIRLEPGDFVLLRGRVFEHWVEDWTGGQRIAMPHFTHTSLWKRFGLEHLVDVPYVA